MKRAPITPCYCGRGCTGPESITDRRIRSERDAVAKYLELWGPMPVMAEGDGESEPVVLYVIESIDDPRIGQPVTTVRKHRQEQAEADPVAKARMAEAIAYCASYTGRWGLILDIRSDKRWGTKYMRLSAKQVDVILAARDRDAAQAKQAVDDPRQAEAREYLLAIPVEDLRRDQIRGFGFEADMAAQARAGRPFSDRQLEAINRCRARRAPRVAPGAPAVDEGMYRTADGAIYKVQKAVNGSGHLYAKRLAVYSPGNAAFEYEQGAIRKLRPEDRMSVEDAEAFGKLYGVCCVCGRTLTDETSIARGIGPICAAKV